MAKKFKTKCRNCHEDILMVQNKGRWKPLDFPNHSVERGWRKHYCLAEDMRRRY